MFKVKALDRCVKELKGRGLEYAYRCSEKSGREYYAFLYRKDMVKPLDKGRLVRNDDDIFIREPYFASFKCGNFDFTVITIHMLYGKSKKDPARAVELDAIAQVYREVQEANGAENDVILTGDFNEAPASPRFNKLNSIASILFVNPGFKTTISDASSYDHIIFQDEYTGREYTGDFGLYKFDEEMFGNDDRAASLAISDHRPIWAIFRTDLEDDD